MIPEAKAGVPCQEVSRLHTEAQRRNGRLDINAAADLIGSGGTAHNPAIKDFLTRWFFSAPTQVHRLRGEVLITALLRYSMCVVYKRRSVTCGMWKKSKGMALAAATAIFISMAGLSLQQIQCVR